jgi:cytochrome c
MKKAFILIAALAILGACGGDGEKKEEAKKEEAPTEVKVDPEVQKGLEVAAKSDCTSCHKIEEKNIGPAWRDVANKYAGQDTAVRYLAQKIISGGAGVWGQVPMAAHPTFTKEEAEAVAKYVLSLKNK